MWITQEQGHADNDQRGGQRPDHGNEFQHSAESTQNQRVGNTHDAKKSGVHDQSQRCQSQLGADEMGQHLIQIVEHVFQKLALRTGLDGGEQEVAERAAIFQEENRKQRDHEEKPRLLGDVGHAQARCAAPIR